MTLIHAAKQALEALEEWEKSMSKGALEAHRILRTAIAEAESVKPVAWMFVNSDGECEQIEYGAFDMDDQSSITLLYTTPPAAERRWVGFTDKEVSEYDYMDRDFVRDIEAVLKHKNTRLG